MSKKDWDTGGRGRCIVPEGRGFATRVADINLRGSRRRRGDEKRKGQAGGHSHVRMGSEQIACPEDAASRCGSCILDCLDADSGGTEYRVALGKLNEA